MGEVRRYRKKPVVVEVMRLPDPSEGSTPWREAQVWCGGVIELEGPGMNVFSDAEAAGEPRLARAGDYIVRGEEGFEVYAPDIFEATYEAVDDEAV